MPGDLSAFVVVAALLVVTAAVLDVRSHRIPNALVFPGALAALAATPPSRGRGLPFSLTDSLQASRCSCRSTPCARWVRGT